MKGTKYLSEVIDFEGLCVDALNIIKAPTGCGKTYFALNSLPDICPDVTYNAVYLIDTINGKEQILRNYGAIPADNIWVQDIRDGFIWYADTTRVVVMTYAKFGKILTKQLDFYAKFKYIICDELHKLIDFAGFSPDRNLHKIAKAGIEAAVRNEDTIVVALTATPNKVCEHFRNSNVYHVRINQQELRHYETKETIKYRNIDTLINSLDKNKVGLCYTKHVGTMEKLSETAATAGLKPLPIWSINNENHPMDEEQLRVRSIILEEYSIPPEYNFLIINASSETSIKIKSPVDYVIVHDRNKDVQTQVIGRIDHDLETVYLRDDCYNPNSTSVYLVKVPESYLNKKLFKEDKKALYENLCIYDINNRLCKWSIIRKIIKANGYSVQEKRENNKRYVIIKPKK